MVSTAQFNVERRVGKLVEARVFQLVTRDDANLYGAEVLASTKDVSGRSVLCADHRPVRVYPPDAADRLVELFRPNNTRFERIAILVSKTNAMLFMQLERITREAGSENRRVFQSSDAALIHLSSSLDETELERAKSFLGEFSG